MSEPMLFHESVRKRPGMYIGDVQSGAGANHMVFELTANALDQHLAGRLSRCDITVDGYDVTVSDDGPGLPYRSNSEFPNLSNAEVHLEHPHFNATAGGHAPHVHLTFMGVGLAVVNALSSVFEVESCDGTSVWSHRYENGVPVGKPLCAPLATPPGTRFRLTMDQGIFAPPDIATLKATLSDQTYLYPGLELTLNGERFHNPRGLSALAEKTLGRGLRKPVLWHRETFEDYRIDIALLGQSDKPVLARSWVNGVEILDGGSHMTALNRALGRKRWKPAVKLFHLIMEKPEFAGPCKNELKIPSLIGPLQKTLWRILDAHRS